MPHVVSTILENTSTEIPPAARALLREELEAYARDGVYEETDEVALVGAQIERRVVEAFYSDLSHDKVWATPGWLSALSIFHSRFCMALLHGRAALNIPKRWFPAGQ